jgi:hypothetical protein
VAPVFPPKDFHCSEVLEFRENLSSYLESKTPVAITRHGATIGIYVPAKPKPSQADLEALRVASEKMQELIAAAGTTEEELIEDFKETAPRTADAEELTMLVLDANILIRAVLGSRVLFLLRKYAGQVEFLAPDTAFQERRKVPLDPAMAAFDLTSWPGWCRRSSPKPTRA